MRDIFNDGTADLDVPLILCLWASYTEDFILLPLCVELARLKRGAGTGLADERVIIRDKRLGFVLCPVILVVDKRGNVGLLAMLWCLECRGRQRRLQRR